MKNQALIAILTVILTVFIIVQAFQINALNDDISGDVVNTATDGSGGETYEEMMARMHPGQASQATKTPQMVGGC